jgi:orotate phosphoribosyltransferase-like protein
MSIKKKGIPISASHRENITKAININHPSKGKERKDRHIAIKCFDLNGIFFKNYKSVTEAALKYCLTNLI